MEETNTIFLFFFYFYRVHVFELIQKYFFFRAKIFPKNFARKCEFFSCVEDDEKSSQSRSRHDPPRAALSPPPKRRKRSPRSRNWAFTDYTDGVTRELFDDDAASIRYVVVGHETCPDTGREHWQGFVQFTTPCSLKVAQRRLQIPNLHMEAIRGTVQENIDYCEKDGDVWSVGDALAMGQRVDIDELRVMLDDGASMLDVARANFPTFTRSYRAFQVYESLLAEASRRDFRQVSVIVFAGTTGFDKTRIAMSYFPYKILGTEKGLQWFDFYKGQDVLLIDEFDSATVPITTMLSLLDGYCLRLPIKGGFTFANWTKVIITTNQVSPLYEDASVEHKEAFDRRVNQTFRRFSETEPPFPSDIIWSNYV